MFNAHYPYENLFVYLKQRICAQTYIERFALHGLSDSSGYRDIRDQHILHYIYPPSLQFLYGEYTSYGYQHCAVWKLRSLEGS